MGQGLQAFFPGGGCPGAAFGSEGQIYIFNFYRPRRLHDPALQFRTQFALLGDEADNLLFALLQGTVPFEPSFDEANGHFVQSPGHLFAIPGDERYSIAFIQQFCYYFNLTARYLRL